MKNTHGGVLLLVKACNFTKSNTAPWVFFTFLKLQKWYHIAQRITYNVTESNSVFSQISKKQLFKTTVNGWKLWLGCECVSVLWWAHYISCYFPLMENITQHQNKTLRIDITLKLHAATAISPVLYFLVLHTTWRTKSYIEFLNSILWE